MAIGSFEQDLITAIENIKDNPTKGNVKALKSFFTKSFNSNQATLFEIFSGDRLTYEQQKFLFDSIEPQSAKLTTKTSTQPEVSS